MWLMVETSTAIYYINISNVAAVAIQDNKYIFKLSDGSVIELSNIINMQFLPVQDFYQKLLYTKK